MLIIIHKDKMVRSVKHDHKTHEYKRKPANIANYFINKRLSNMSSMQIADTDCLFERLKQYMKLFFHFKDITLMNSYNLFLNHTGKHPPQLISD